MPINEYECPECHRIEEHLEMPYDPKFKRACLHCMCEMNKIMPSRTYFRLINGPAGFWSSHGYADRITPENDTSVM